MKQFLDKIPFYDRFLSFITTVWQLWLPLAVASVWIRLVAIYHIVYCEKFQIDAFERAISSDLNTLTVLTVALVAVTRKRAVHIAVALLYCFLLASNAEFISENDSNLDFSMLDQALNGAFVESTMFSMALVEKTLQLAGIFAVGHWLVRKYLPNRYFAHYALPLIMLGSFVYCLASPLNVSNALWKQTNLVEDYVRNAINARGLDDGDGETKAAMRFYQKDLSGAPVASMPAKPGTNVLVVIMESVGADHIEKGWMPFLDELSQRSLYVPNFYTASANTINGEYALLCGDAAGLAVPRPGAVKPWQLLRAKTPPLYCLPQILASAGYNTVYMQSADLSFQSKGKFMPLIGFRELFGGEELAKAWGKPSLGKWGPDDSELYDHAMHKIMDMQQGAKPWMMAIMTISTHYPANVPDSFQLPGITDPNNRERSSRYADQSLKDFLRQLNDNHVLDNTVVVITNDEVRTGGNNSVVGLSRKNHGVMMVLTPNREVRTQKDMFGQTDFFLSMMDYLGFPTDKVQTGRSIFREYKSFAPFFFGNYFTKFFIAAPAANDVLLCSTNTYDCKQYSMDPDRGFYDNRFKKQKKLRNGYQAMITQLLTYNRKSSPKLWVPGEDEVSLPTGGAPAAAPGAAGAQLPAAQYTPIPQQQ